MVKRVILGRTGEEKIVDLIKAIDDKVSAGHTTPAGTKVLDDDEDLVWSRPDGTEHSVRDIDEELEGARGRIEDAEQSLVDSQVRLDEAEQAIASTAEDLTHVETVVIPAAVQALEEADAAAQEQFDELDTRLGAFATDEALAPLRQALSDAQAAVETAQGVAQAANQAANAASQAALEAAGIAASKGRVIIQETEPVGEDRNAANIWIKPIPDDPTTEIEEKAITYVYLEGSNEWVPTSSDELAQAAQNALDAREAAQQAQQRADTAISNAAAAQAAAEAAQRTADDATLDAREAHNEAVAAQERLEAKIASGDNLILNGSFEDGDLGWPTGGNHGGRSRIIEDSDARAGSYVLELTPDTANVYPETDHIAVEPGRVLHIRGWFKHLGGDGTRVGLLYRTHDKDKTYIGIGYAETRDPQAEAVGEWFMLSGDYEVPEGVQSMRFAFHASGASTSVYHADALQVLDVTEARAAQARADEAYAEAERKLDGAEVDARISTSANGKNSITRSLQDPFESGAVGVVRGDQWYQVDGYGDAFASWYWGGTSWVASKVRNEMIDTIDVNKLKVHDNLEVIGDAVIDKIWADGISAKAITTSQMTVSSGDLAPSEAEWANGRGAGAGEPWRNFGLNATHPSVWIAGDDTSSRFVYVPMPIKAGVRYAFSMDMMASKAGVTSYVRLHKGDALGSPNSSAYFSNTSTSGGASASYIMVPGTARTTAASQWITVASEFVPTESGWAYFRVWGNHTSGTDNTGGYHWFRNFSLRPMVGAVLIEDGAITTPKLTVTSDMSAAIVNAMTTNTKKLVVTKEAILNHATLIGQTVVDDINVNGKLVGTNGVFTGTVDFANVNVTGELLADTIMADKGLVAGGPDGQVVIDGAGVTRYETDSDGQQIETFRLGPQGGDIATFGDTTISPTGIGSPEGAFDQLSVGGEDLGTILSALPRGMRAWGTLEDNSKFDSDTTKFARRAELQTTLLPDRLYRVRLSSHFLDVEGSVNATVREELRYSLDQTNITTGISPDSGRKEYTGTWLRQHVYTGDTRAAPGMEFLLDTEGWTEERHFWVMFMILPEQASRPVRVVARWDYPVTLSVEDMGPSQAGLLKRWNDGSGTGSQDPEPTKRRYTKTYASTGHRTYDADGSASSPPPADVVQGLYGGGPSRLRRRGGWTFPSFTSDLSGATVEKIEAYVYMNHSYYSAGADVNIATHNGTVSNLTSRVTVKGWKRNSGKWVTLPKSLYNGFKSGTYKGVGVISTSSSAQQYARFNGSGAKIRITYVK